jgi:hypothetical protein
MEPVPATATAIEFGRFRVLPHRRELLAEGRPADLGGRAFDVLMVLIEASGAVVGIVTVTCREPMSARAIRVSCSSDGELPLGRRFG